MQNESKLLSHTRRKQSAMASGVAALDFSEQAEFEADYVLRNVSIGRLKVKRNGFVFGERLQSTKTLTKHDRYNPCQVKAPALLTTQEADVIASVKRDIGLGRDPFGDNDPFTTAAPDGVDPSLNQPGA